MKKKWNQLSLLLFLIFIFLTPAGCTSLTTSDKPDAQVALSIPSHIQVGALVIEPESIKIRVTGPGMNLITQSFVPADVPEANGIITLSLDITAGDDRVFVVEVEGQVEGQGFRGTKVADIPSGGAEVSLDMSYLNFAIDGEGDQLAGGTQDISSVEWSASENAGEKSYVLKIFLSREVNTDATRVAVVFDTDGNSSTGELIDEEELRGINDQIIFGGEVYLEVVPDFDQNPLTADLILKDAVTDQHFAFSNQLASANAAWEQDLATVTITFNELAATEFLTSDGFFLVAAGAENFNQNDMDPQDLSPDPDTGIYDLGSLLNQGPFDE